MRGCQFSVVREGAEDDNVWIAWGRALALTRPGLPGTIGSSTQIVGIYDTPWLANLRFAVRISCVRYRHESSWHRKLIMVGPEILVRALSVPAVKDRYGNLWQYHSRSDRHSKIACWCIMFDLLTHCQLLRKHASAGKIWFGINHNMSDFRNDRAKKLDLVLSTGAFAARKGPARTLADFLPNYSIKLTDAEISVLDRLPSIREGQVGSVLIALEAKACMTAHQRALPRFYDELNSSHLTVHGATDQAIAAGFAMINVAERFLSTDLNKKNFPDAPEWSSHNQPRDAELALNKVKQIPRRSAPGSEGYDALSVVLVDCRNDGSRVRLVTEPPAPTEQHIYHYDNMIDRLAHIYATRFKEL